MEELQCVRLIKEFNGKAIGTKGTIVLKYTDNDFEVGIYLLNRYNLLLMNQILAEYVVNGTLLFEGLAVDVKNIKNLLDNNPIKYNIIPNFSY